MSTKKTRRESPAVNAGSMADIAFLLLIFFLVTTTIAEEKGVLVKLPEWSDAPIPPRQTNEDDVLTVHINKLDKLLIEDDEVALTRVRGLVADHLKAPGAAPGERIISLRHDRATTYAIYLAVYDELKAGYHELWDELALERYNVRYDFLDKAQQTAIRQVIPMVISEAEPTEV